MEIDDPDYGVRYEYRDRERERYELERDRERALERERLVLYQIEINWSNVLQLYGLNPNLVFFNDWSIIRRCHSNKH